MTIQIPVPDFVPHKWQIEELRKFDNAAKNGFKDKRFFVKVWHRRARKTTLELNNLIKECVRNPNSVYGYILPTYKQAKNIIWTDPNMLNRYLPNEIVKRKPADELIVEFKNGSVLSVLGSDQPDSIRGRDFRGVAFDEYSLQKREVWTDIIMPIMANKNMDGTNKWASFNFTPKGRGHSYELFERAKKDPLYECSILRASESGLISKTDQDTARHEMSEIKFLQEFECEFNSDASSAFKGISKCYGGQLEERNYKYTYVTGADLAKHSDFYVAITMCRETRQVVDFQRFNQRAWSSVKESIIAVHARYNSMMYIDATGVGDPIVEDLQAMKVPCEPIVFDNARKTEMIERLSLCIEQRLLTFPYIPELVAELEAYTWEWLPSGKVRYGAPEGLHDDCVTALALAVEGCKGYVTAQMIQTKKDKPKYADYGVYKRDEVKVETWDNL